MKNNNHHCEYVWTYKVFQTLNSKSLIRQTHQLSNCSPSQEYGVEKEREKDKKREANETIDPDEEYWVEIPNICYPTCYKLQSVSDILKAEVN